MLFRVSLFIALVLLVHGVFSQFSTYSHPEDSKDDKIGTDLDGMKELFNDTLSDYDTRIRPRLNQSQVVEVNTSFIPQSLLEFDTSEQKFSVLGYFRIKWYDEVVTWTPADYSDTNTIKVPVTEIWTPSLIVLKGKLRECAVLMGCIAPGNTTLRNEREGYNPSEQHSHAFDGDGVVGNSGTDIAKISSEGFVQWVPEGIYSVVCNVDIKYYPFDEQTCVITYYVSDETIVTVKLDHAGEVTLDEYTENSAWKLESITKRRYLKYNTYYIDVEFKLRRRANFTTFTLIMPLLMLAFLNICIFLVPIGSGEKGSFAITIFLSYGIFVTIVSDTLPDNSLQISYFLLFIIFLLFMSVMSVLYTIIQAKIVSSIGDKECTIKCCRPKRISSNKVMPFNAATTDFEASTETGSEVSGGDADDNEDTYTWTMFMEKLDTIIFICFFVLISLFTSTFFGLLLKRVSETSLEKF